MPISHVTRPELSEFNSYPLFVDYDFAGKRPRGGSAYIDLFSHGRLCMIMDESLQTGLVYIQKDNIMPVCGFFLIDFRIIKSEPVFMREILDDMQIKAAYIEKSIHFPITDADLLFDGLDITFVKFTADD
jgi:hypothetical protein